MRVDLGMNMVKNMSVPAQLRAKASRRRFTGTPHGADENGDTKQNTKDTVTMTMAMITDSLCKKRESQSASALVHSGLGPSVCEGGRRRRDGGREREKPPVSLKPSLSLGPFPVPRNVRITQKQ